MIRILHVLPSLGKGMGIDVVVINYYRFIDRDKIQFDFLISAQEKQDFEDEVLSLGGRVFRRPFRTKKPIENFLAVKNIVNKNKEIKIVHIHHAMSLIMAADAISAALGGVKIRIAHSHNNGNNSPILHALFRPLLRLSATHYAGCATDAARFLFGNKLNNKMKAVKIFANARDLSLFQFSPSKRAVMRRQLALESNVVVIHVARLAWQKNQEFLLEAFARACKQKSGASLHLLIAGDGELREKLEKKAGSLAILDKVSFLGLRSDVHDLYQAADIFMLSSLFEGLSSVTIEAQAAGLPCLVSDTCTREVKVSELVEFLPIDSGVDIWAERLLFYMNFVRKDTSGEVSAAGYNIQDAARDMADYYYIQLRV